MSKYFKFPLKLAACPLVFLCFLLSPGLEANADSSTKNQPLLRGTALKASKEFSALRQKVSKFTLSNGLRVLVYKRDFAPIFTGQIWVKVGGVDEVPGQTGLAHFLEHMAFKGSKTIGSKNYQLEKPLLERLEKLMNQRSESEAKGLNDPKIKDQISDVSKKLEELWLPNEFSKLYKQRGGVGLNAGTSKDYTVYMVSLPSSAFDLWLWLESDRLLNPVFRQFYKEREVIQEERRGRVDNDPGGKLYEALLATAYWTHPNRLPVIGWPSDMRNLSASDMRDFYHKYYRPDNMVIVLVGDLDAEQIKPELEKYFGRIKANKEPRPRLTIEEEPQVGKRESIVYDEANPQFFMAWHKPAWPDPDDAKFAVLHSVLGEGRSSILYRELVQDKQLALNVYTSEAPGERYPPLFIIGATPRQGISNERLRDEIQKTLDRLAKELVDEKAVAAAKRRVRVAVLSSLDSNSGMARMLGKTEVLWDDWEVMFESYDQILGTSPSDLRDLVRKYLSEDNRTWVHLETSKKKEKGIKGGVE